VKVTAGSAKNNDAFGIGWCHRYSRLKKYLTLVHMRRPRKV
jgi:hypothetical protein